MKNIERNTLFYGDNLEVMRDHIPDESIDLIYLDPPFNSNRSYNVLFRNESGKEAGSQIKAFDDAWHWGPSAEETYQELITNGSSEVATMIGALRQFIHENQMMAYLVMMAARLVEMRRVLKPTGSIYLHCDPTASHYLKIILDMIFGGENFNNEIVWRRQNAKGLAFTKFASDHDIIFKYSKTRNYVWNSQYKSHDPEYLENFYKYVEQGTGRRYSLDNLANPNKDRPNLTYEFLGVTRVWRWTRERMEEAFKQGIIIQNKPGSIPRLKRYLDEQEGTPIDDIWDDILPIQAQAAERLGYPTQKPLALLERIIQASSNEGDIVLDPFSGCGTAISAAQKLRRLWIGIDITYLAIAMHKSRLKDMYDLEPSRDYDVIGEPMDLADARELAQADRYQFQWWALSLVKARPVGSTDSQSRSGKKGSDQGVDGIIPFIEDTSGKFKRVIVQVKSGHVNSAQIRDLHGVLEREQAPIGLFICLDPPTSEMIKEAVSSGYYYSEVWQQKYPRIQMLIVEELLKGIQVKMPPVHGTYKSAERVKRTNSDQEKLGV